jgi:hypothetical protein
MKCIEQILIENEEEAAFDPKEKSRVGVTIIKQIHSMDRMALPAWGVIRPGSWVTWHRNDAEDFNASFNHVANLLKPADKYARIDAGSYENTDLGRALKKSRGGVILKVKGSKHRGLVAISLNGLDLYDVVTGRTQTDKWVKGEAKHDIYAEDLIRVIDDLVG